MLTITTARHHLLGQTNIWSEACQVRLRLLLPSSLTPPQLLIHEWNIMRYADIGLSARAITKLGHQQQQQQDDVVRNTYERTDNMVKYKLTI